MAYLTYADYCRPVVKLQGWFYDLLLMVCGSWLIAGAAQVAVYLPGSPVPVSGQTLAVLLVGAGLGSQRGSASVLLYLWEGVCGLPVFAQGHSGAWYLLGPTGGYLVGFVAAAYLVGRLSERGWDRHFFTTGLALFLGNVVIYVVGLSWLVTFTGVDRVLMLGLYPYLAGDIVKLLMAMMLLPSGWRIIGQVKS